MKSLFIVAFLVVAAFADNEVQREKKNLSVDISFSGNVTVANDAASYAYRRADIVDFGLGVFHSSVEINGEATAEDGDVDADFEASGIFGLALQGLSLVYPPFSMMGYFDVAGNLETTGASAGVGFDFSGSSAFLGMAFPKIQEINSAGEVVKTVPLKNLVWTGDLQGDETDGKMLKYYVMSGTNSLLYSDLEVTIGYIVSNVIGKLSTGATITPKSVETQIEIMNYPYADETNQLKLTMVIADARQTGSAAGTVIGNTYIAGDGADQVYVAFAGDAVVDGSTGSVSVTLEATADVEVSNTDASALIATFTSLSGTHDTDVYTATATFPANAASISYDPSSGFEAPNSSVMALPTFVTFVAVLFALYKNL